MRRGHLTISMQLLAVSDYLSLPPWFSLQMPRKSCSVVQCTYIPTLGMCIRAPRSSYLACSERSVGLAGGSHCDRENGKVRLAVVVTRPLHHFPCGILATSGVRSHTGLDVNNTASKTYMSSSVGGGSNIHGDMARNDDEMSLRWRGKNLPDLTWLDTLVGFG
jgi:hypothetical protein